jgi:hypothetical protein
MTNGYAPTSDGLSPLKQLVPASLSNAPASYTVVASGTYGMSGTKLPLNLFHLI